MRRWRVALALLALAGGGCAGDDERRAEPRPPPDVFEVEVGNVFSGIHAEWDDGTIALTTRRGGERRTITVRPSPARWRRFWDDAERLGAWEWERAHELRPVVPDAESWRIELRRGGRRTVAEGLGTYPAPGGGATRDRDQVFVPFLEAVDRLLGGRLGEA